MGNDKYGLDWTVWGNESGSPKKDTSAVDQLLSGIGKEWSTSKKQGAGAAGENDDGAVDDGAGNNNNGSSSAVSNQNKSTFEVENGRFIPDETTDFNKECKIAVDLKGTPKGKLCFSLWALYEGKSYNLNHEKIVDAQGTTVETTLTLYYEDHHYNDLHKGKKDATIDYFAKISSKYAKSVESSVLTMPLQEVAEERWIKFEETVEKIDPSFPYEMSEAEPAKNRFMYVFVCDESNNVSKVFEVLTDSAGKKYSTWELTEENYQDRPKDTPYEEVAFIPATLEGGVKAKIYAALSEHRVPVQRIFDTQKGIIADVTKRCSDIDDSTQVCRKVTENGEEEIVVLVNWMRQLENERKRFDAVYTEWEASRRASWFETDEEKKKQKLEHEFGAAIIQIVEAYPEYRKHFKSGKYPELYERIRSYDNEKVKCTTSVTTRLSILCRDLLNSRFSETCCDYTALVQPGEEQVKEWTEFEERAGRLLDGIERFEDGIRTIQKLLPSVKEIQEHTWLQDTLTLKNEIWGSAEKQNVVEKRGSQSAEKQFQNYRKIGDGFVKLLVLAVKADSSVYKPEEMAHVITRVFKTTGMAMEVWAKLVTDESAQIRPFSKVLGSFDEKSFWRFEIKPLAPEGKDSALKAALKSKALAKFLLAMEGIALVYSLKEHAEKTGKGKAGVLDQVNMSLKLMTYFIKSEMVKFPYKGEMVKLGGGPIAVLNAVTSGVDFLQAIFAGKTEQVAYDTDAAVLNYIAASGYLISTVGSATLVSSFLAGAAVASSTGIGIAPGTILAFIGAIIAIGSKAMAAKANNTHLEDLLLKTPWGINPQMGLGVISSEALKEQYLTLIRIINSITADIDNDTITATLHLRSLEPETIIMVHEIEMGIPMAADGSQMETDIVKVNVQLSENNCTVIRNEGSHFTSVKIDLKKLSPLTDLFLNKCRLYFPDKEPRPEYIRISVSIDLYGDKMIVVPGDNKKAHLERYYRQDVVVKIK